MEVAGPTIEDVAEELRPETRQLLQTVKDVDPAVRRLALTSAPFGVRTELVGCGLSEDDASEGFRLTAVGEAILDSLPELSVQERQDVAADADRALSARLA